VLNQDVFHILIAGLIVVCTAGSLYVWGLAVKRWKSREPLLPEAPRPPVSYHPLPVLLALAWMGMGLYVTATAGEQDAVTLDRVKLTCFLNVLLLALFVPLLVIGGKRSLSDYGISFGRWKSQVGLGVVGFLASVLPVAAARIVTQPLGETEPEHSFLKTLLAEPSLEILVWIGIAAVLLAPLWEELLYRVIFQGWLQTRLDAGASIVITALAFSTVHPFPSSLALIPLALVLGYLYYRQHSYLAVVVTHMLFNATNLLLAVLTIGADPK
jgi:uncharacterized protein